MAETEDLLSVLLQGQQESPQDISAGVPEATAKGIGPDPRTALLLGLLGQSAQGKPFPLAFPLLAGMLGGKGGVVDSAAEQQQRQAEVTNQQLRHTQQRQLIDQLIRLNTSRGAINRPIGIPPGGLYNPEDKSTIPALNSGETETKTEASFVIRNAHRLFPGDIARQQAYVREQLAKDPTEVNINPTEMEVFATGGPKGRSIPKDMTIDQAKAWMKAKLQPGAEARSSSQGFREDIWVAANLGKLVNKKTGKKATEEAITPSFEQIQKDYVAMSPVQLQSVDALGQLDNQIDEYRAILPKLKFPKPGIGVLTRGVGIKLARQQGDPDVRKLDSIRSAITQIARNFGGDSRVSDKEMELLGNAVIKDFESDEGADAALKTLEDFRATRAKTLGIPGLMQRASTQSSPTGAIPIGQVPMINPKGQPVTIPSGQVKAALEQGYKPYGK